MKIAPLKRYTEPGFPTRSILDEHPELLMLVPKRWRAHPVVIAALTGVCLLLSLSRSECKAKPKTSKIAPIFVHGEGRGGFGCKAINPPVFLSEDEARQVIVQEAKKAGLSLEPDVRRLRGIDLPVTNRWAFRRDSSNAPGTRRSDLVLDGWNRKRSIAYEYISASDFDAWEKRGARGATVYVYDILPAATVVRKGLARAKPTGSYAVFYDPLASAPDTVKPHKDASGNIDYSAFQAARRAEAEKLAREYLRRQVRDFIKWLKAQGAI